MMNQRLKKSDSTGTATAAVRGLSVICLTAAAFLLGTAPMAAETTMDLSRDNSALNFRYHAHDLQQDCRAAETHLQKGGDKLSQDSRSQRCLAYVHGFLASYQISQHLAQQIGIDLNAFCPPPQGESDDLELVRALLRQLERLPQSALAHTTAASQTAAALSNAYPCAADSSPADATTGAENSPKSH